MAGIFVIVPGATVIAVRHAEPGHPLCVDCVTTTFGHDTCDESWRTHIILQPLVLCTVTSLGVAIISYDWWF